MCPLCCAAAAAAMLAAMASLYSRECHQKGCDGICSGGNGGKGATIQQININLSLRFSFH